MTRKLPAAVVVLVVCAAACGPRAREYELRGVVVAIDPGRQEITIKHEDIPRFMPGMTMPFKVRDAQLLQGRAPGDVVRATLVVEDSNAHLRDIVRTGSAPVPDAAAPPLPDVLEPGELVPDAGFVDQHGGRRQLSDWRGQVLAVTFIYTRCPIPNFCPLMDRHFRSVQDIVLQDRDLVGRVRLVSVSFDPAHDTPAVLASRSRELGADPAIWTFVTGESDSLEPFASRFGVSLIREDAPAAEIVHNLRTAVIDTNGRVSVIVRGNEWTPAELLTELRKALAAR